jgi:hypothetical protein
MAAPSAAGRPAQDGVVVQVARNAKRETPGVGTYLDDELNRARKLQLARHAHAARHAVRVAHIA